MQLLDVGLERGPLRDCFLDPLPTNLQSLLNRLLFGLLRIGTEPFHHCQELRNEAGDPAWKFGNILLNDVEFFELW